MKKINFKNVKGFTLVELLVVIAIIGLLSTLTIVALNSARAKSRDAKRVNDIKQLQSGLEIYLNDQNAYPTAAAGIVLGSATSYGTLSSTNAFASTTAGTTYMAAVPTAAAPIDGTCTTAQNDYTYTSADGSTYTITFCLGGSTGSLAAGVHTASPAGVQ